MTTLSSPNRTTIIPIRKMTSCSDNSSSEFTTASSTTTSVVSFQSVQIREYERIAGDHPDVTDHLDGPPLSIGWKHSEIIIIPIDSYESSNNKQQQQFEHKQHKFEPITGEMRKNILQYGFNVPSNEIEETMKEVKRIKEQRERTLKDGRRNNRIKRLFGRKCSYPHYAS